ncbi:MAG TPA: MFS transporter [Vicinamibacterales bacterium]|nr:MFS transporter [Vicinamibacterales bacterium]
MAMFSFWHEADSKARRSLVAASLGWMLDSFDVMLYALVVQSVMADLVFDAATGGRLQSYTLLASAAGGLIFGVIADRYGRTRALILSVLIYSVFTALCGLAQSALQLAVFRVCLGIGMGGEWASGAALVSETWPGKHRGKALAFVQSSWAVGYGLAVIADFIIRTVLGFDWRVVFFVGIAPALLALWVRRNVDEPEMWQRARRERHSRSLRPMVAGPMLRITVALTLMNAATMFAWWGFNTWVPSYLTAAPEAGGVGLSEGIKAGLLLSSQIGMWFGYVSFGYIADAIGRKRTYVGYLVLAALFVWLYTSTTNAWILLAIGPFTAFFATGYFSGFGAVSAELYPTSIRATAQGLTYNIGRVASALAPWMVGGAADVGGYAAALSMAAIAFIVAAALGGFIPETKGRAIA